MGTYGGKVDISIVEFTIMQYNIQGNLVGTISDLKELTTFVHKHNIEYPAVEYTCLESINETTDKFKKRLVKGRVLIKFDDA